MIRLEVIKTDVAGVFSSLNADDFEELLYNNQNDEEIVLGYEFEDTELVEAEKCFASLSNVCHATKTDSFITIQYLTMYQETQMDSDEQYRETMKNCYPSTVA